MGIGVIEEARAIKKVLETYLPKSWDGKKCILELKEANFNWKQMEWVGWYFEYKARKTLVDRIGGGKGPRYGKTSFDYQNQYVWDFKSHLVNSSSHPWAIMNDCEAANSCIEDNNGMGFIIALGKALYNDEDGSFYKWHQELKGGKSKYVRKRIARGAPSRKRKTAFELYEYLMIFLQSKDEIERAIEEGWLSGNAQIGWRNADGSARRAKYQIKVNSISNWAIV
jgi:hypothetical protein